MWPIACSAVQAAPLAERWNADHLGGLDEQADHVAGVVAALLLLADQEDRPAAASIERLEAFDHALDQRLAVDLDQVLRVLGAGDLEHRAVSGHQHDEPHAATLRSVRRCDARPDRVQVTSSGPSTTSTWAPAPGRRLHAVLVVLDDDRFLGRHPEALHAPRRTSPGPAWGE